MAFPLLINVLLKGNHYQQVPSVLYKDYGVALRGFSRPPYQICVLRELFLPPLIDAPVIQCPASESMPVGQRKINARKTKSRVRGGEGMRVIHHGLTKL